MWTLRQPLDKVVDRSSRRDGRATGLRKMNRTRLEVESLEARRVCSAGGHPLALAGVHHHAEVRPVLTEANHAGAIAAFQVQAARKKQASFTLAQEEKFLPGKWVAVADVSSTYGTGSYTAVEVVFTGPKGVKTFSAISALSVPGYFGRSYYQFGDSGTYQFIKKNLVRMTILQASPTEYLGNPILVMSGQFLGVQFVNKNQFIDQGVTYNREPLNQSIFNQ
jgi:hypothetical protein